MTPITLDEALWFMPVADTVIDDVLLIKPGQNLLIQYGAEHETYAELLAGLAIYKGIDVSLDTQTFEPDVRSDFLAKGPGEEWVAEYDRCAELYENADALFLFQRSIKNNSCDWSSPRRENGKSFHQTVWGAAESNYLFGLGENVFSKPSVIAHLHESQNLSVTLNRELERREYIGDIEQFHYETKSTLELPNNYYPSW